MFRNHTDIKRTTIGDTTSNINPVFKCDMCDAEWLTENDVEIHRKETHLSELLPMIKSNKSHICLMCARDQGSHDNLLRHIKSQHLLSSPTAKRIEREIFICDLCNNLFFNKMMLVAHIQYMHGSVSNRNDVVPCPSCYKLIHVKKLWFHFCMHQINIISTCQICFLDCKNTDTLHKHLKSHTYYYKCDICNFDTNKEKHFANHIHKHKRRKAFPYKVKLRKYFIPAPKGVWKYMCETGVKGLQVHNIFICVLCREICSKNEMEDHIFIDHAPETVVKRKLMCSCGEEFFNTILLKHHIFKMKGNHKIIDDSDFGKLLAEDGDKNDMKVEKKTNYCNNIHYSDNGLADCGVDCHDEVTGNYAIIMETSDNIVNIVVPLQSVNEDNMVPE